MNKFTESRDEFGPSFCCNKCGKNQFYTNTPETCDHQPKDWEVKMHEEKLKRDARIKLLEDNIK